MTLTKAFPTQEIGSLPKFSWRTKPFRQMTLDDTDIVSAKVWGERLQVPGTKELLRILSKRADFSEEEKKEIVDFSLLYAIRMSETAGEGLSARTKGWTWSGAASRPGPRCTRRPSPTSGGFEFIGKVQELRQQVLEDGLDKALSCVQEQLPHRGAALHPEAREAQGQGARDRRHHHHGVVGQPLLHREVGQGEGLAAQEVLQRQARVHAGPRQDNQEGHPRAHREAGSRRSRSTSPRRPSTSPWTTSSWSPSRSTRRPRG